MYGHLRKRGVGNSSSEQRRRFCFGGSMYEMRPMVGFKLLNRQFDKAVLRAIFEHESECKSLVKLPKHPSTWGWASRSELAKRMGFTNMDKTLSRKIRKSFLWLEEQGYLKHHDINQPGKKNGATRFLIVFWVFRVMATAIKDFSRTKEVKAFSRTEPIRKQIGGLLDRASNLGMNNLCLSTSL